jgi:hypothetical protein
MNEVVGRNRLLLISFKFLDLHENVKNYKFILILTEGECILLRVYHNYYCFYFY